jgi:hypothetical protein
MFKMMRWLQFKQSARWAVGAFLLSIVQVMCAPNSAWAGCNHLVGSQADHLDLNRLDALIVEGFAAWSHHDSPRPDRAQPVGERRAPCAGLSCSSRVPYLPASTTSFDSSDSDQWCSLDNFSALDPRSRRLLSTCEPGSAPAGETPSIFHPPRG